MGKTAILSKQLTVEKHGFERNVCISVGSGKGIGGLWVSRNVFLRHRRNKKGAALIGRKAAAAPRERSPEREFQVQPVGPCTSGERGHLSLSNFVRFDTCHIQRFSAPSYSYKILFWINTFCSSPTRLSLSLPLKTCSPSALP